MFIGRTDAKAETLILWPPHVKSWLIGKDPDAGRNWGQEEKGPTKDEMAGWHHRLDAHEFGWTPEVGVGQGGLACCNSWGRKESDMTEWLNWTAFFIVQRSHQYMTTGKTITLTTWTFVRKVMSLLFNTLFRFVADKYYIYEGTDLRSPLTFSLLSSHSLQTQTLHSCRLWTWGPGP